VSEERLIFFIVFLPVLMTQFLLRAKNNYDLLNKKNKKGRFFSTMTFRLMFIAVPKSVVCSDI